MNERSGITGLERRRERHRASALPVRLAVLAGGWLLAVVGLLLLVPLPEVALPTLLVALRVLALRFGWAARIYTPVAERATRLRERWRRLPLAARWLIPAAIVALILLNLVPRMNFG